MFTLLVEPSTSNNSRYDTTITVYKNNEQLDGFISHSTKSGSNTEFINKAKEFYPDINENNTKVVLGI